MTHFVFILDSNFQFFMLQYHISSCNYHTHKPNTLYLTLPTV
jgi:hypothetical protein